VIVIYLKLILLTVILMPDAAAQSIIKCDSAFSSNYNVHYYFNLDNILE